MRFVLFLSLLLSLSTRASADTLLASDVFGAFVAYDPQTHASTVVAQSGVAWYDIALSPAGVLFASSGQALYRVDLASGASVKIGAFGVFINGLTFDGATLYACGANNLYRVDPLTGAAHKIGGTGLNSSGDLAVFTGSLYMTATQLGGDVLLRLDPLTGRSTVVGPIGFSEVMGLAATASGLFGFTGGGEVLLIDPATGTGVPAASLGHIFWGATAYAASPAVPEPSALILVGSTLLALAARARRH